MRHLSKTYRFAAALLVLSLSLGVLLPLMQHVCAMDHTAAMTHTASAAPRCDHHAAAPSAQAAAPGTAVFDVLTPRPEAPCCLVGPASPRAETPALLPASPQPTVALLPVLAVLLAEPNDAGQAEHPPASSPPSLAPVPLHVLHAAFLN